MAEDMGEKTEAPTPRRRQEAREQGQIARSADLTASVLLLGFLMLMHSFGPGLVKALRTIMEEFLSARTLAEVRPDNIGSTAVRAFTLAAAGTAPLLIGAVVIALVMNFLQVGFFLSSKRLQPNLNMLNPLRGLSRIFQPDSGAHLAINVLKMTLVGLVAWSAIGGRLPQIIGAAGMSHLQAFGLGVSIIYSIGIRIAVLLLVLALIDYGYQRYRYEQQLKMSKDEVREEMRRMEGDPKIRQRRRQVASQMAMRRLKKDVSSADVVITNPTEFAIALKYDSATMNAPRVVAKGQGYLAMRIRETAIAAGVPIIERKPLARALYKLVQVGQEVPEQFYSAVAEILAYVYELTGRAKTPAHSMGAR